MAGSTYNYIANQEKGIEAAANYETLTDWKIGNTLDGLTGQTKTLTDNYTIYPGYSGVYTLDPGGAHRNIVCSSGFRQGSVVFIVNTADAAENLMFDSAGINLAVGQNQRGIFSYDGSVWKKVYIGS
jgi:hypothetical protein